MEIEIGKEAKNSAQHIYKLVIRRPHFFLLQGARFKKYLKSQCPCVKLLRVEMVGFEFDRPGVAGAVLQTSLSFIS